MSAEAARTGEGAQAAGYLLPELGHPDIALVSVAVRRHREAPGEPQVIVLALQQAARQRVMLAGQRDGAVPALADPGQSSGTVTAACSARAAGSTQSRPPAIARAPAPASWSALRRPGGPAPSARRGAAGDGLQFAQRTRAASHQVKPSMAAAVLAGAQDTPGTQMK